jgi:hypothetical protein
MIKIKTHGLFYALNFGWVEGHIIFSFKSHASLVINTSCILLYLQKALCIECNYRLKELLLGELIQGSILWLVTKKLVIPFLCNLSFASLFYQCIVSSHIGSFANLTGYPPFKPISSFLLTSLTYLSLEYWDDMSQEGASKGRFNFPLIKTSGTYLNTTSSLLGDEQTSEHGGGGRYYEN